MQLASLFEGKQLPTSPREFDYFVENGYGGDYRNVTLTSEQGRILYQAVLEDIGAGRFGSNEIAQEETRSYACNLSLYCLSTDQNGRTYYANISLNADNTSTIAALKEMGLVTEEHPLVTTEQANRDGEKTEAAATKAAEAAAAEGLTPDTDTAEADRIPPEETPRGGQDPFPPLPLPGGAVPCLRA